MNTPLGLLPGWLVILLVLYAIYTIIRAIWIWGAGWKEANFINGGDDIKLYHILWSIVDVPAIILSILVPILKFFFNIPVYPRKKNM